MTALIILAVGLFLSVVITVSCVVWGPDHEEQS